jgi:hypothetical protein
MYSSTMIHFTNEDRFSIASACMVSIAAIRQSSDGSVYPSRMTSSVASANVSHPFFKSAWEMLSGGMKRTVSYAPVVRITRPLSRHRFATRLAKEAGADGFTKGSRGEPEGDANSTPTIRPWPLTSRIFGPTMGLLLTWLRQVHSSLDLEYLVYGEGWDQIAIHTLLPRCQVSSPQRTRQRLQ